MLSFYICSFICIHIVVFRKFFRNQFFLRLSWSSDVWIKFWTNFDVSFVTSWTTSSGPERVDWFVHLRLPKRLYFPWISHTFDRRMFELFRVECLLWLSPVFQNMLVYSLVEVKIVFKCSCIDSIFTPNFVLDCELSVVPDLLHLPFFKAHVVVGEGLLAEQVAGRHLKDLFVEVLLLNWNLELQLWLFNLFLKHISCIGW